MRRSSCGASQSSAWRWGPSSAEQRACTPILCRPPASIHLFWCAAAKCCSKVYVAGSALILPDCFPGALCFSVPAQPLNRSFTCLHTRASPRNCTCKGSPAWDARHGQIMGAHAGRVAAPGAAAARVADGSRCQGLPAWPRACSSLPGHRPAAGVRAPARCIPCLQRGQAGGCQWAHNASMCLYTFSVAVLKLPVQRVRNSCTNTASLSACLLILSSGDTHLPCCSSKLNAHCCRNEQVEAEPRGKPAGCAAARAGEAATLVMAVRLRAAFGGMPGDVQMLHGFAGLWAGRCAPRCTCACACACAGWVHLLVSPVAKSGMSIHQPIHQSQLRQPHSQRRVVCDCSVLQARKTARRVTFRAPWCHRAHVALACACRLSGALGAPPRCAGLPHSATWLDLLWAACGTDPGAAARELCGCCAGRGAFCCELACGTLCAVRAHPPGVTHAERAPLGAHAPQASLNAKLMRYTACT